MRLEHLLSRDVSAEVIHAGMKDAIIVIKNEDLITLAVSSNTTRKDILRDVFFKN